MAIIFWQQTFSLYQAVQHSKRGFVQLTPQLPATMAEMILSIYVHLAAFLTALIGVSSNMLTGSMQCSWYYETAII